MTTNAMNPDMLAMLEAERQFSEAHSKSKVRRVKIEKPGQAWLVRFLPVGLGKANAWYVRQGQHWLNKSPIVCPRCVSADFGGNDQAQCPVCELADALNNEDNDEVSKFGFKLRANLTYLTYCLVYQIDPGRGEIQEMEMAEILKPWEFQHYQSSFDELVDYFRRGRTEERPLSVLDEQLGNDFWATKGKKGIRLDRQDPAPLLHMDDHFEANLDKIYDQLQQPRIKLPTLKDLETFARKAEAAAYGDGESEGRRGGRGREDQHDEHEEESERPSRRIGRFNGNSRRPTRTQGEEPQQEEQGQEEQGGEPQQEEQQQEQQRAPARQARPAPAATNRPAGATRQAPAAAGKPAATSTRPAAANPAAKSTVARPAGATRPAPAAAGTSTRPAGATRPAPATATRPSAARRIAEPDTTEEEDPGVAEEQNDQAGPAGEPLPEGQDQGTEPGDQEQQQEEGQQEGQEQGEQQEEAPPAPARTGNSAAPAGTGIRNRLLRRTAGQK